MPETPQVLKLIRDSVKCPGTTSFQCDANGKPYLCISISKGESMQIPTDTFTVDCMRAVIEAFEVQRKFMG